VIDDLPGALRRDCLAGEGIPGTTGHDLTASSTTRQALIVFRASQGLADRSGSDRGWAWMLSPGGFPVSTGSTSPCGWTVIPHSLQPYGPNFDPGALEIWIVIHEDLRGSPWETSFSRHRVEVFRVSPELNYIVEQA
jgi:hypothetical protein